MKKKLLSLTLALCMLPPAGAGAADVLRQSEVTRGEFVNILAESAGEDLSQSAYLELRDYFDDGTGQPDHVKWAFDKWLVNGDGTGRLRMADPITRQEAAVILGRYLDYRYTALPAGCGTGAPSMADIAAWAQSGVMQCWMYGVIDMGDASAFHPEGGVSLDEARQWCANAQELTMCAVSQPEEQVFADALVGALDAQGNWALSPYSIRLCLAMLANGAKGETQRELLAALRIDDLDGFNAEVETLLTQYDGYARILSLDTANSIWLNRSQYGGKGAFEPAFRQTMADVYRAEAREVTRDNAVEQVNAWVKDKTRGKIASILTEDDRDFVAALVNAVYFKAAWENEFPAQNTKKGDFTNADGTKAQVEFMRQTDYFSYYATPGIEAVSLPFRKYAVDDETGDGWEYFRDADFSMYFIKADNTLDMQHFLDYAAFEDAQVRLSIPKFRVEYGTGLNDALRALGVQTAFDRARADLTAMVPDTPNGRVYLDSVLHKTYLSIDEKGAEAAAVTAAIADAGAAAPTRPPLVRMFTADSPFWFAIRDNASGTLLFVGRYEKTA